MRSAESRVLPIEPRPQEPAGSVASPATRAPIRVLHFHSSKGLYGPERWTFLALRALTADDVRQEVLTIGAKPGYDEFARFLRREGWTAHHLAIGGKLGLGQVRAVRQIIRERRPDVLHTHGFKSDILGYLATRGLGVGLVTTPHGWCDHESFRIRVYETIGRAFLRRFDRIYPLSDHQLTVLAPYRLGPKVRRIRNAVDIDAFDAIHRGRVAAPRDTVLFVGRLAKEKGLFDLIEAVGLLANEHRGELVVVGEGPGDEAARALAQRLGVADRVRFAGFQEDVRPFLARAAMLALPSYSEGIPRVVMEAFAAGVPVVGSRIPGLEELIEPGRTGLLVPVGDVAGLARAIRSLLDDEALGRELARNARAVVECDYSPSRLASELRQEYHQLAARRGAPSRLP